MILVIIHLHVFIQTTVLFIFQNTTFRKLDSVSVFGQNPLSWAQSIELAPISGLALSIEPN
jgi:hypothetical protein